MIQVATHSGSFHADDVFAVATLQLLFDNEDVKIIRSRDESVLSEVDYVVDVGGEYNHEKNRYDHHQPGAPVRNNGIPYAGFGLVWKHYGAMVCNDNDEIAAAIEERLVLPVDAGDNGISLYTTNEYQVQPFELFNMIRLFAPAWGSDESKDDAFIEAVSWARRMISRMIEKERANVEMKTYIQAVFDSTDDKRMLVFDKTVPMTAVIEYAEVMVVVCPDDPQSNQNWSATCVRKSFDTFEGRAVFPKTWAGLREEELAKVSGINDAIFCHRAGFIFIAGSKDSALQAVQAVT